MTRRQARFLSALGRWFLLALVLLVVLFPIYWMIITSFKTNKELYSPDLLLWVRTPTFDNFGALITQTIFGVQLRNSFVIALVCTVVSVVVSSCAAYSLARLRYPGRGVLSVAVYFVYLIPASLMFIPMYTILRDLTLLDTIYSLILSYLTFTVPFCIWMLRGYFQSIPIELEEAAMVDGCTRVGSLYRIVMPLAAPGVAAAAIFAYTLAWNEFLYALVFINGAERQTAPVGISMLIHGDVTQWGQVMGAAIITCIPVLVLYTAAQRYVVTGLTAGSVKG